MHYTVCNFISHLVLNGVQFSANGSPMSSVQQIGKAIHVESSNIERQPSTDARRPCNRDSDVIQVLVLYL